MATDRISTGYFDGLFEEEKKIIAEEEKSEMNLLILGTTHGIQGPSRIS